MTEHWMQALNAVRFDIGAPESHMVDFRAMARVLARLPRFGAHTEQGTISVAQHSREGAYAILRDTGRRDAAAAFLLHDGHEYVTGDLTTPVAKAIGFYAVMIRGDIHAAQLVRDSIHAMKSAIDEAIYAAAGIPWPLSEETVRIVHEYDLRMGRTERDMRLRVPPAPWGDDYERAEPVKGCDLTRWSEEYACGAFAMALDALIPF